MQYTDISKFIAIIFNLRLVFLKHFIGLYWLKIGFYGVYIIFWKSKFKYSFNFWQIHWHVNAKIQVYGENNSTLGITKL